MDIAREAGFREVHLAAEPDAIGQEAWNESESGSDS
jgi:hypothetical protein